MAFSVQYIKATGVITATVNSDVSDENLPDDIGQLKFDEWCDTMGKAVDIETLQLVDVPAGE